MNATELIIELVLTGVLALAALLLPLLASLSEQPKLTAETIATSVALGFLLGVIVDRCADSLLGRWEGFIRCRYACSKEVTRERRALIGLKPARDVFPENWMRVKMMSNGGDGITKWLEQSRVRIRIARTVTILVPALTVSALATIVSRHAAGQGGTASLSFHVPALHLSLLVFCFGCAEWWLRPPRTDGEHFIPPSSRWLICSASSIWLVLELIIALGFVIASSPTIRSHAALGLALGVLLTLLAALTWWRLMKTFAGFVWTFCRAEHRDQLVEEMTSATTAPTRNSDGRALESGDSPGVAVS